MKIRHVPPPVVLVEAAPALKISPLLAYNLLSDSRIIL
jgi:hypothetical protein